jgi:hypothetical protein
MNGVSFTCKYITSIHVGGDLYDVVNLGGGQTGSLLQMFRVMVWPQH